MIKRFKKDNLFPEHHVNMVARNETAVSVLLSHGHLLLLKRRARPDDPWSGDMCFPGGFAKEGETPYKASLRELREETGIEEQFVYFQFEHKVFHPVRSSSINVHPFVYICEEMLTVNPDSEIERGGWYKLGSEVRAHDERMGDYIKWNGDIVWGLTFRIYDSLKNILYEMSINND